MKFSLIACIQLSIIALLFNTPKSIHAQDSTFSYKSIDVHIMPFNLYYPRVRVGIEYQSIGGLGYSFDFGYADGLILGDGYHFQEFRPEIKYYFPPFSKKLSVYTSIEGFISTMKLPKYNDQYYPTGTGDVIKYDKAILNVDYTGFHLKGGMNVVLWDRLEFDGFLGFGLANKSVQYTDVENPIREEYHPVTFRSFNSIEKAKTKVHWTTGCKIGYILWRK